MKTFLFLSLTLTATLGVPVPEWEPVSLLAVDEVLPPADVLPEQGHVIQEDTKPDAGLEKMVQGPAKPSPVVQKKPAPAEQQTMAEVKAAPLDPVVQKTPAEQQTMAEVKAAPLDPVVPDKPVQDPVEEPVVQKDVKEEDPEYKSPDEQGLDSSLLQEEEPAVEEDFLPKDEPGLGLDSVEEENAIVPKEVHPMPGRLGGVEEPTMELEPEEEEEAEMRGYLAEEEADMVEQPEMELEPLPEEEPAMPESDLMEPRMRVVEEPEMELDPLPGEEPAMPESKLMEPRMRVVEEPEMELDPLEEELTSQDEPGTEGEPAEEEELMEEEGPAAAGETVLDVEESPEQTEETEPEEPVLLARSGFARGPLMDGMTVKQAMMEEEPDMWVGPDVVGEGPVQGVEEEPNVWSEADEESAAVDEEIDTDNRMVVNTETHNNEDTGFNLYQPRSMDGEFPEVATKRRSCRGVIIDGRCYRFFRGPMKAPDAEYFCQRNFPQGHLASVTNSYIHQQMMNLMAQNGGYTRTWIGGLRYLDTGRFIWLDGAHWDYADWLVGEPNNTAGVENCVELLSDSKFNDMPCWDLRAYICSYPLW
ncbi:hypothetical protein ACEWY4_023273 [Coilia grayii]|uniref:C-type lectin domain-containing protein n=1 Tax=Coilia grayii TaxID=363190 RepID=A0ABD1J540_9TELE